MPNRLVVALAVLTVLTFGACESGPGQVQEPPVLTVSSPARSLIQGHAGPVMVTGTATPNASGDAVERVMVNNVQATLGADGSFAAMIDVREGATLIETVARDARGTTATDTRAVQAGQLRPVGTNVPGAIAVAMSADAFARISAAAGPILTDLDLAAMLAPLQPMVSAGSGCNYIKLSVEDVRLSDATIALTPVHGGLAFRAEIDHLDVPGGAAYRFLCGSVLSSTLRVTADKVVIAGTLHVAPRGTTGFTTTLVDPDVTITRAKLVASVIPPAITDLLNLDEVLGAIAGKAAELAMGPLMNQALGALAGPQTLDMFGQQLTLQVAPSAIAFEAGGAALTMSLTAVLAGSEASPGFLFTDNGTPTLDVERGFQLGIADDLANEMLAELRQIGALDLTVPAAGGAFETAKIQMTLAPMIAADARDGRMRLVLGDMFATFLHGSTAVGKAAINAAVDLEIEPVSNGYGVALRLGTPEIHVNLLDDVANTTGLEDDVLGMAAEATLASQLGAITKLLVAIPLPQVAGLQVRNLSIGADEGYVMIAGQFD